MHALWRVLHLMIIAVFVVQVVYCAYVVMVVLQPEGMVGPLGSRAATVPIEVLVSRRLYAIEGWLSGGIGVLYLAITEIAPRHLATRSRDPAG